MNILYNIETISSDTLPKMIYTETDGSQWTIENGWSRRVEEEPFYPDPECDSDDDGEELDLLVKGSARYEIFVGTAVADTDYKKEAEKSYEALCCQEYDTEDEVEVEEIFINGKEYFRDSDGNIYDPDDYNEDLILR